MACSIYLFSMYFLENMDENECRLIFFLKMFFYELYYYCCYYYFESYILLYNSNICYNFFKLIRTFIFKGCREDR